MTTPVTDEQWDKQIASQERIELARIDKDKYIEAERLRAARAAREGRVKLLRFILGVLAFLINSLGVVWMVASNIQASEEREHQTGIQCIVKGGTWIDKPSGEEDRCELPR